MKLIKIKIIILILTAISISVSAQSELDNYLVIAAENNPGLKAKFNEYMAALEKVPQVGTLPDPAVAFGYFLQPVETRVGPQRAKISLSQMFPWFGTLNAREDAAAQVAKAKYELFEEEKSRLYYDIKSTWYNLYFTSKSITIIHENLGILNTFQKLALVKIEAGKASAVDELRIEMEILDMEDHIKLLTDQLSTQEIVFNNLINNEDVTDITITDTLISDNIYINHDAILDSIRINNHQVLSLEFQEAAYEYQQIAAKKQGSPNFNIGLDYIFIGKSSNNMISATESGKDAIVFPKIEITVPIYRKKYTSMVKEAIFMQQSVQNARLNKINIIENVFEKTNTEYKDASRRITLHNKQMQLALKALRILESDYATNGKNFEELLRMERQVLKHKLEVEKAVTDLNASVAFINYLTGK